MRPVLAAILLFAATARAGDADDEITRSAKEHFKLGTAAYAAGRYVDAIKELKLAYALRRLPPILNNIAMTYDKMGDSESALYYYKKFLAEAPPDASEREGAEKRVAELAARKPGGKAKAKPAPNPSEAAPDGSKPDEPAKPEAPKLPTDDWVHKPVEEAQEGQPIMVRVKMPVLKGVVVELHHRRKGEADYTAEVMKRAGADKVARIAAEDVTGTALQYYIEAKDPRGDVVKRFGSATEPFIVLIER